jgi:hypothetical protein
MSAQGEEGVKRKEPTHSAGLREAVALEDGGERRVEELLRGLGESSSSRHGDPEPSASNVLDLGEDDGVGRSGKGRQVLLKRVGEVEDSLGNGRGSADLSDDTLPDGLEDGS